MQVVRTIQPGQPGTRRFLKHWGNSLVAVRIAYEEHSLRNAAKTNRARWSAEQKVWVMPYSTAVALGLRSRIVEGLVDKCRDVEVYDD